jgi:hypothetical protein
MAGCKMAFGVSRRTWWGRSFLVGCPAGLAATGLRELVADGKRGGFAARRLESLGDEDAPKFRNPDAPISLTTMSDSATEGERVQLKMTKSMAFLDINTTLGLGPPNRCRANGNTPDLAKDESNHVEPHKS